jgi:hypothetical protein
MVAVQQTVRVPRCVEKRIPVTYTRYIPRTVCCRVPLNTCLAPVVSSPVVVGSSAAAAASGCPGCAPGVTGGRVEAGAARPSQPAEPSPEPNETETGPVPDEMIQGGGQPSV